MCRWKYIVGTRYKVGMQFYYKESVQLDLEEILQQHTALDTYRQQLQEVAAAGTYKAAESSVRLPLDTEYADRILALSEKFTHDDLELVIVVGIGGSSLGTRAVYDALQFQQKPSLVFLETIDESTLSRVNTLLREYSATPEKFVINVISKSGLTTESLFNFERVTSGLDMTKISERVVVTTDEGSLLWNKAEEYQFHRLAIPQPVGGRYSVLSAVGQFPLRLAGVNVDALLKGAHAAVDANLGETWEENKAFISAAAIFLYYQKNIRIHDLFLFAPQLESLGKWYRQLMGESIGKVSYGDHAVGITPTVSVGTTDLHSVAQLYIGGPNDRLTTFVKPKGATGNALENLTIGGLIPELRDTNAETVLSAMYTATKREYSENELPYLEIILDSVSEFELGYFMQTKMVEMMYLGKLLNVNAFNQPDVEGYKAETRRILAEGKK